MQTVEGKRRLAYFNQRRKQIVADIRELVEVESPSDNKAAVDRIGVIVARKFAAIGGNVRFHRMREFGNHLQVDFPGPSSRTQRSAGRTSPNATSPVLLLGHCDTVYPIGTLASSSMACRVVNGK